MTAPDPAPGDTWDLLIVDDDPAIREGLLEVFTTEGYRSITASDGHEALGIVERGTVRLVLLDLMLPKVSGWEFLKAVRATPALAKTPVLVMTAFSNAQRPAGAPVFLKPLNIASLARAVGAYLR